MSHLGPIAFLENLLAAGLARGTPLLFASIGEVLCERAGVLNLGLEGLMLLGAATGFGITHLTGSLFCGLIGAMTIAALVALIHGVVTITLTGDQVVSGLGLGFLAAGLASIVGADLVGIGTVPRLPAYEVPGLRAIPILGPVLFSQNLIVYLGLILIPLSWLYLHRTRWGLMLKAVGESPSAADAQGISVARVRYGHVALGGSLAGLAGASLSLAVTPGWVDGITVGQGWIAIGLVIFSGWEPTLAAVGSYLFGAIRRLPLDLQGVASLPFFQSPNLGYFLDMLPYLFTILALVFAHLRRAPIGFGSGRLLGKSHAGRRPAREAPAALGQPFIRGDRGK